MQSASVLSFCFFFNDTATTEIYTLSLHDALPIFHMGLAAAQYLACREAEPRPLRSEEHTSELQSPCNLVCRLLLEKKTEEHNITQKNKRQTQQHCFTADLTHR